MYTLEQAQAFNILAFLEHNKIVNENQSPIEFYDHYFLKDIYLDYTPEQVVMKCAQIGDSTTNILKAIHLAKYRKANVIYTLPSRSIVKDFVSPKVDPLISSNPVIAQMVGKTDSTALKSIGDRFIYFRGSWEIATAISISAHVLINDELDRSKQDVITTYRSRLDEAKRTRPDLGFVWQFSNPSIPGNGVDEKWQLSDQKHWFIICPHCNYEWYLRWPDNINMETEQYICSKCHRVLPDEARRKGRWVNKKKSAISGYWISQLMAPWIPASKIIEDSKRDPSFFYNFTLGLPYVSKDYSVTRKDILNVIDPSPNPRTDVAIGVDVGVLKHYVIGNKYGIFKVGTTESWDEIEDLRNRYSAYMVIDMMPYPNVPKRLIKRYNGKVFGHYFDTDRKMRETVRWGTDDKQGIVYSDRTRIIDDVVAQILAGDIWFNLTITDLEEYILNWGQLYRTTEERSGGIVVPVWKTIEGRADHFCLVAGTKIETLHGEKNIEDITVNDYVLTRKGYKKVKWAGITKLNAKTMTYIFSNGKNITATPEHKVFTKNRGFIPLNATIYSDIIETCQTWKKLFFKIQYIVDILIQKEGQIVSIILQMGRQEQKINKDYTKKYGSHTMAKFLKDFVSIIKMVIVSTMRFLTLSVFYAQNISQNILKKDLKTLDIKKEIMNNLKKTGIFYLNGKKQKQAKNIGLKIQNILEYIKNLFVLNVVKKILLLVWRVVNSVKKDVSIVGMQENGGEHTVYNLEIEDCPEYYANGILLHNCLATVYWYIALQKTLTQGGVVLPSIRQKGEQHPTINVDDTVPALNLSDVVRRVQIANRKRKR